MKFQIKNRFTGNILFSVETDSWKLAVEAGIKAKANLSWADLSWANLSGANLSWADLSWANLSKANLSKANLSKANLSKANLPAPTMVLLARWFDISAQLTADLMLFDSTGHPNPEAFAKWAAGGSCPYSGVRVQRLANFQEQRELWGSGKTDTIYSLMVRLLREKCKTDL